MLLMWLEFLDHSIMPLISIELAFKYVFVSTFSGSVKVYEIAVFTLKFLYIAIVRPAVLKKQTNELLVKTRKKLVMAWKPHLKHVEQHCITSELVQFSPKEVMFLLYCFSVDVFNGLLNMWWQFLYIYWLLLLLIYY